MKVIEQNVVKTQVMDWNAAYYGLSIYDWMDRAGKGIAQVIRNKYKAELTPLKSPLNKGGRKRKLNVGFFCGLGNNGGDGFAAARYLGPKYEIKVFLFGTPEKIKTEESQSHWQQMLDKGIEAVVIKSSKNLKNVDKSFDIVVDCLLGTGVKGKVREPIASGVKLFNKIKGKKIAIDFPTQRINNVDQIISMQFPKTTDAEVVELTPSPSVPLPRGEREAPFISKIGWGEFRALDFPGPDSHKGNSGKLLIIAGNEEYHGALLYSIKTAAKVVDLIYLLSSKINEDLARKLRSKTAEYIPVNRIEKNIDCIMVGPGMGKEKWTIDLATKALKTKKKIVLDADVLEPQILEYLHDKVILTPHAAEFKRVFGLTPNEKSVEKVVKKSRCTLVLKGKVDIIGSPDWGIKYNYTGNVGMTKGGTGDVMASLIAAFYCLTDDPYIATAAGVFVNGLAGDDLYEKVNRFYDAEDLVKQLPKTLARLVKL